MTDEQIHLALNTDNVLIDATFKIVACAHDQLFTIHSNVKIMGQEHRVYCPIVYVLMGGRRTIDYYDVFLKIIDILGGIGQIKWKIIVSDYEKAMWSASRQAFGQGIRHYGCWFHYTQALYKKIIHFKLESAYLSKQYVYDFGRRMMCMAFLEPEDLIEYFEMMKNLYRVEIADNAAVKNFFTYVEDTWISGKRFSPNQWTVFERPHNIRTTNAVENWNGRIWKKANQKKIHIYVLAQLLHTDAVYSVTTLRQQPALSKKKGPNCNGK